MLNGWYNTVINAPATPTWQFHALTGWYIINNMHVSGDLEEDITFPITVGQLRLLTNLDQHDGFTTSITIFARWIPYHTLTFDTQGGNAVANLRVNPITQTIASPADQTRNYHAFLGWFTTGTGDTEFNFNNVTTDSTVYAQWQEYHTLTFNTQGGSAVANLRVNPITQTIAPPTNPTHPSLNFIGWFTAPTGGVEFDFSNITNDAAVYARWTLPGENFMGDWEHAHDPGFGTRFWRDDERIFGQTIRLTGGNWVTQGPITEYVIFTVSNTSTPASIRGTIALRPTNPVSYGPAAYVIHTDGTLEQMINSFGTAVAPGFGLTLHRII